MKTLNIHRILLSVILVLFTFPPIVKAGVVYSADGKSGSLTLNGAADIRTTNWNFYWEINIPTNIPVTLSLSANTFDNVQVYYESSLIFDSYTPGMAQRTIISTNGKLYVYSYQGTSSIAQEDIFNLNFETNNSFAINGGLHAKGDVYIDGNLGIGTTNPQAKLHVNGAIRGNQAGGALQVKTDYGYVNIGPQQGYDWAHIYTDLPKFIFNKPIHAMTGEFSAYYTTNLSLQTYGTTRMTILQSNGNVGIGTTSPTNKLEVAGSNSTTLEAAGFYNTYTYGNSNRAETRINLGKIESNTTRQPMGAIGAFPSSNTSSSDGNLAFYTRNTQNMVERVRIDKDGKVGIGTTTPKAKLDVGAFLDGGQLGTVLGRLSEGNPNGDGTFLGVKGYETQFNSYSGKSFSIEHYFWGQTNSSINFFRGSGETGGFITFNTNNNSEKMRINTNGNVSIGTKDTNPTDELLTVFGVIHAKEVQVDLTGTLADFVFHPTYNLMPLHEVEQYVKTNSHLPEIPSAAEVRKNGMSIGEMQNKLLQKVEELTLYLIEQQKTINQQSAEIEELKKR